MAFTEQDFINQTQEIGRLADELRRLNTMFAEQKKILGYDEEEEVVIDASEMTPQLEDAMQEAKLAAEREGRSRASAVQASNTSGIASPNRSRRGAIRI